MRADAGHGPVGPGGYVAAIKAAQLGLRVSKSLWCCASSNNALFHVDGVHREAGCSRWNLSERRMHSLEGYVKQLAHLPPDETRLEEEGHRGCA